METDQIKLTQYTLGGGCGCKIAPADLQEILGTIEPGPIYRDLLVGRETKDDAAVYDLGDGSHIVSTTDFFTPIVDSPYDFGRIAAANAISDVFAMGGQPLIALAILAWPLDKLPKLAATEVLQGARKICHEANIPLAGGHSINISEVLFGLAVTGRVEATRLRTNAGAKVGDIIYLTKKIGTGMLSSALKRGEYSSSQLSDVIHQMCTLNILGRKVSDLEQVHALTDVTGFGLAGHLLEMSEAAQLTAYIRIPDIPTFDRALIDPLLKAGRLPGNTGRNYRSYGYKCAPLDEINRAIVCDPQTNGGLLLAVDPKGCDTFLSRCAVSGIQPAEIGYFGNKGEYMLHFTP